MAQQPIVIQSPRQRISPFEALLGLGILIGASWFGWSRFKKYRAEEEAKKVGSDPAAQVASIIHEAKGFWGDDEDKAIELAERIGSQGIKWEDVVTSFNRLYNENINAYLNSFMSAEQMEKFTNALNFSQKPKSGSGSQAPPSAKNPFRKGDFFLAKVDSIIRKTPVKSGTHASSLSNRVGLAKLGELVGIATGEYKFDAKNDILFYQVQTAGDYKVWIAASNIQVIKQEDFKSGKIKFPKHFAINKAEYDIAASPLAGPPAKAGQGSILVAQGIATLRRSPIFLYQGQSGDNRIKTVQAGQAIGIASGRFSTDAVSGNTFYEVTCLEAKNPDSKGLKVWVDKKEISFLTPDQFRSRASDFNRQGGILLLDKDEWQKANSIRRINNGEPDYHTEIITANRTEISDEMRSHVVQVPGAIILGYKVSEKGNRVKFQSLNGINWWVNKESIKEVKK